MSEIRQNKATKEWVIFAPSRRLRPHDFAAESAPRSGLPKYDPECPFCPGNERALLGIISQFGIRAEDAEKEHGKGSRIQGTHQSAIRNPQSEIQRPLAPLTPRPLEPSSSPWQTRVVPNRYPALTPDYDTTRITRGIYLALPGYGKHEIVIESPYHNRDIAEMSVEEVRLIIETYHRRYLELMKTHENTMILIFRNHGPRAGTSLAHPHSQIIVSGVIPNHMRHREEEARRYYDDFGRCVYCDILVHERAERRRVIFENRSFVGYIPFAANVPFETALVPKRHAAGFGQISEEEKSDLALALRDVLARLRRKLNDPDYNYMIHTSDRFSATEPQLHWFLDIQPRLTTPAGFEIGTGISINPSLPEEDAELLNK